MTSWTTRRPTSGIRVLVVFIAVPFVRFQLQVDARRRRTGEGVVEIRCSFGVAAVPPWDFTRSTVALHSFSILRGPHSPHGTRIGCRGREGGKAMRASRRRRARRGLPRRGLSVLGGRRRRARGRLRDRASVARPRAPAGTRAVPARDPPRTRSRAPRRRRTKPVLPPRSLNQPVAHLGRCAGG